MEKVVQMKETEIIKEKVKAMYPDDMIISINVSGLHGEETITVQRLIPSSDNDCDEIFPSLEELLDAEMYQPGCSCEGERKTYGLYVKGRLMVYEKDYFRRINEERFAIYKQEREEYHYKHTEYEEERERDIKSDLEKQVKEREKRGEYPVHVILIKRDDGNRMALDPKTNGNFNPLCHVLTLSQYNKNIPNESGDYWIRIKWLPWGGYYEIKEKIKVTTSPHLSVPQPPGYEYYSYDIDMGGIDGRK